jgi:hypothetical protein
MDGPMPGNTSGTARLLLGAPSYEIGWQEPVYLPDPPPGDTFSYVADGRFFERVLAVTFTFSTSAVVADRFVELFLKDTNGANITSVPCGGTVTAGSNLFPFLTYDGLSYAGGSQGGTFGKLPDLLIPPGWSWNCTIFGIDAADTVTDIVILTQRFPNDTAAITAGG